VSPSEPSIEAILDRAELFQGLGRDRVRRAVAIGRARTLEAGRYLFLLGDNADEAYVVLRGSLDLCLPIALRGTVKDVRVESVGVGQALGWSALVRPYRFTLSARATEPSEVIAFARVDLQDLFEAEPAIRFAFLTRVSEVVGTRLVTFQALWVRELQRAVESEAQRRRSGEAAGGPG
jgi:CRP-like cAMP-binding protein